MGRLTVTFSVKWNLKIKLYSILSLSWLVSIFPNLDHKCILALSRCWFGDGHVEQAFFWLVWSICVAQVMPMEWSYMFPIHCFTSDDFIQENQSTRWATRHFNNKAFPTTIWNDTSGWYHTDIKQHECINSKIHRCHVWETIRKFWS